MRSKAAVLRRCPVFADASPDTLRSLAVAGELRTVARRAPLHSADQAHPLVLRSGVVRESSGGSERAVTYGFHGRGDLLGSDVLVGRRNETVLEAYEDCVVLELPTSDVIRCLAVDAGLLLGLARWENQRVQRLQTQLQVIASGAAPRRLASALLRLAKQFGVRDSRGTIVNLRMTHRELAGLIGSTRETVSVTVNDLRKSGLIHVDGKRFVLLDKKALGQLAEEGS